MFNASGATLILERCSVTGNSTNQFGGGVYNDGSFTATNCTFSGNSALRGGGIISRYNNGAGSSTLLNCTITGNTATSTGAGSSDGGGGVYAEGGAKQHYAGNTIIAGNNNFINPDVRGQFTSDGHNFIGSKGFDSLGFTNGVNGDQVGPNGSPLDPQLGPLGNNGGPTQTCPLLSNSSAIDQGDDLLAPPTDQRLYPRLGVSDIGAFESGDTSPPTPTPTPTITPTPVNISGAISYCSNPVPGAVPNVTLTLTGDGSGSTLSDGSGNYTLSSLPPGGSYTVTPSKASRTPGSSGINTVDVIAVQKHFLNVFPLLTACHLTAADVNGAGGVNTVDIIAIQKFFLNIPGTANVGKYQFTPASISYSPLAVDQTAQDYATLIFGDVIGPFADRAGGVSQDAERAVENQGKLPANHAN